jgi:hypothetical protein
MENDLSGSAGGLDLPWRPSQRATAEKVDVEMRNSFSAMGSVIDHEAVSAFGDVFPSRYLCRRQKKSAEQGLICLFGSTDPRNGRLWNAQNMHWRLRRDIPKGQTELVFKNDVGRNLAGDDFFEKGHDN